MNKNALALAGLLTGTLILPGSGLAQTFILKDDVSITGDILNLTNNTVTIMEGDGSVQPISLASIREVRVTRRARDGRGYTEAYSMRAPQDELSPDAKAAPPAAECEPSHGEGLPEHSLTDHIAFKATM